MERTIGVVTEGGRGALVRISGLMERRGFQVKGVTAGVTQRAGVARYTLVIGGGERQADQAMRQIRKMVETVAVEDLSVPGSVERCMMLLKFTPSPEQRTALFEAMKAYPHSVADDRGPALVLEMMGPGAMLDDCLEKVKGLGLVESVKSGPLALGTN
ncbi:MAG: acetolactate synthase small subunit [Synergistaceae bacterium]|nr:acetolactate synthase small subunit [Synergistaceae bacterium]